MAVAPKVVTGSAIIVDGYLNEWSKPLRYNVNQRADSVNWENICTFDTKWDNNNFYIGIDVYDETVVTDFLSNTIYENDGIEIFLDAQNTKLPKGMFGSGDYHIMIRFDGEVLIWGNGNPYNTTTIEGLDVKTVLKDDNTGYTMEVAIPFASIGVTPKNGTIMGLEVANNDNDNHTEIDRRILYWSYRGDSHNNPAYWGAVTLYDTKAPVISNEGKPLMGVASNPDQWNLKHSIPIRAFNGATVSFGSMCDSDNLYLGMLVKDPNNTFNASGATVPEIYALIDGDNHGLGIARNSGDIGRKNVYDGLVWWKPTLGTIWSPNEPGNYFGDKLKFAQKNSPEKNEYFVVVSIAWEALTPKVEDEDYFNLDNYRTIGLDVYAGDSGGYRGCGRAAGIDYVVARVKDADGKFVRATSTIEVTRKAK